MKTFRAKSANTYKRYTPVQLASTIRQLQTQFKSVSKKPTWQTVRGKTVVQQCRAISNEIHKIARIMRSITVQQINVKIRTLKSQFAQRIGVKVSSPKASSTAVKRLKAKIKQINQCRRVSTLIKLCTGVKLSTFKNPKVGKVTRTTRRARGTRRTATRRRTGARRARTRTSARRRPTNAYRRQAKTLKKQVHKLKRRNSFMSRLVNQFRRKVAKLQRSYRAANAKPRWRVVSGRGTSNVVRLNRGTSTTWNRQAQRRVG